MLKEYIKYCNTPVKNTDNLSETFIKGLARALPIGAFTALFTLGHVYNDNISLLALGLGSLFLIYLLGLI